MYVYMYICMQTVSTGWNIYCLRNHFNRPNLKIIALIF